MATENAHAPAAAVGAVADPGNAAGPLHRMEDVVKRTGLTSRAIRYYEEVGLLTAPSRTAGGFRLFTEDDVAKLTRIKELQTLLGSSLAEIKESLRVDAARAELRQAYAQATDADTRLGIVERAAALIQSQITVINERVARLMQLRAEYAERLTRLGTVRAQIGGEQTARDPPMSDAPGKTDLDPRAPVNGGQQAADAGADGRGRTAPPAPADDIERVARRTVVETAVQPRLDTRRLVLLAGTAAGVLILIALGLYWRANLGLVKTDNAQTTGDLSPISSRITGLVVKVNVVENTRVAAGAPLVELDPSDYRVALAQAQANLTGAQAQVRALRAALGAQEQQFTTGLQAAQAHVQATQPTVSQAQAQLDLQDRTTAAQLAQARSQVTTAAAAVTAAKIAADTAAKALARDRQLLAQGAIAQQQVDTDESAAEQARAQYQAAQDALAQARSNVLAAQAARQQVVIARNAVAVNQGQLANAQALVQQAAAGATVVQQRAQELAQAEAQAAQAAQAVRAAQLNLDRTVIRAPAEGRVTNRTVEVGQVVLPNQPLMSLTLPGVWVVANVKETQLGGIRPGQPVRVRIDTYRGRTYHGTVESVGSATGSTTALLPPDNATGNFVKVVQLVPVRIVLDPAELRRNPLQVGLSAEVAIDTRSRAR